MDIKVCVAGKICTGKSTLAKRIAERTGYPLISFGGILKDHLVKSDLSVTRESLQRIGQELIDQLGYDGFLRWSIEHSPQVRWDGPLIVDGLRHGTIYTSLVEMFPRNVLVYCVCDPETQLARLMDRDEISEDAQRERFFLTRRNDMFPTLSRKPTCSFVRKILSRIFWISSALSSSNSNERGVSIFGLRDSSYKEEIAEAFSIPKFSKNRYNEVEIL